MKKFLPIFLGFIFAFCALFFPKVASAQTPTPSQQLQSGEVPPGQWVIDPEVTFIGKNAARSGNLLDFTLQNYNWVCVRQGANGQCDNRGNPLQNVWLTTVTYIVVPLLFVVILAAAVIIIVTRGRSITIMRFLPRFLAVLLLIFFSFALLQFFYQFIDVIQGFFLRKDTAFIGGRSCPPTCISQQDLLYVGWNYKDFIGLRLLGGTGDQNAESAFVSLLLTKLTALTYYVMVGILYLRKIILWLFIIVSPVFPILLLFYPIRNTGKIWIGEFFRWLLYAPLFAIFLKGLVVLWRTGIPLVFNTISRTDTNQIVYPTAVNILLGGPKEFVTPTNSVNLTETFALYVVSLIMLWGVIILPWILLQIFLDYASNIGVGDSAVVKTLVNKINNLQPPGSPRPSGAGDAISLPFTKKFNLPTAPPPTSTGKALEIPRSVTDSKQAAYMPTAQVKAQVQNLTNVPLPTMRDIAKYETSLLSKDKDRQKEVATLRENLQFIGNPAAAASSTEREHFTEVREKLVQESKSGNTMATSILNAANVANKRNIQATASQIKNVLTQIANPQSTTTNLASATINKEKIARMNESLVQAKQQGNALAASILAVTDRTSTADIEKLQEKILDAKAKGEPIAAQLADITQKQTGTLPVANRVQTVSREDYEAVKDMWKDNYRNLEVPEGMAGTRTEWIKADMTKIEEIIKLLSSQDEEQVKQGMDEVSGILPFLLVGGFSQAEILSYLKAKLDAAKDVAAEVIAEEEDKVTIDVKKTTVAQGHLAATIADVSSGSDDGDDSVLADVSGVSVPQGSDQILSLVNMKLPKISDIARYETLSFSKEKEKSAELETMHQILASVNDPSVITNTSEREKYEKIREKLVDESKKGNIMASAVLSAASGASVLKGTVGPDVKTVFSQIANPALATDKERFSTLHEELSKASAQGDTLATSLLSVKETATKEEIDKLHSQLLEEKEKGHPLAASVLSTVTPAVALPATNRIQQVSKEDYQAVKDMWKENYTNLEIPKELAESRTEWIANDIAKINGIVTQLNSGDPEQVQKGMGEVSNIVPFLLVGGFSQSEIVSYLNAKQEAAKEVLSIVTKEENETTMSIDRKQIEIPQAKAMAAEQSIVSSDIQASTPVQGAQAVGVQIDEKILALSNLKLPKLSDIVSYEVRNISKDKTESQRIEQIHEVLERISNPQVIPTDSDRKQYEKLRETLTHEALGGNPTAQIVLSAVSQLAKKAEEIDLTLSEVKIVLQQIVNPQTVTAQEDKDYYTRLHEYLETESREKGGTLATKILQINDSASASDIQEIKEQLFPTEGAASTLPQVTSAVSEFAKVKKLREVFSQIISPLPNATPAQKERLAKIRESLMASSDKGNELAKSILSVNTTTSDATLRQIDMNLSDAVKKGDPLAKSVLSQLATPLAFSPSVRLQDVTEDDYKEAFELWKKAYKQYLVPPGFTEDLKGRLEWINKDIEDIEETIDLLNSDDPEKRNEGTKKVSGILPFLLLGGFSFDEMLKYLQTKLAAAHTAIKELQEEEEGTVAIPAVDKKDDSLEMKATEEEEKK
jgi:hypothetical protein